MTTDSPATAARSVESRVLELVLRDGQPVVIVDSPPGAGKTRLVTGVVAAAHVVGVSTVVAAPRNEQVHDLARRLLELPIGPINILRSAERPLPADLQGSARIVDATDLQGLGPGPVVATVAKLGLNSAALANRFGLLICDEAYQVPFAEFMPLTLLAEQHLLVGDPGQLPPLVTVDAALFEAARHKVHWPAPRELLRRRPELPVIALPATWRFTQDSVDYLQPAFYPALPFTSAVASSERRLALRIGGLGNRVDDVLDRLAAGQSLVLALLPGAAFGPDEVDDELAAVMAEFAARILARRPEWVDRRQLGADDLGLGDSHVASGERLRAHLDDVGVQAQVTTPEIWQGRQRPLMIVKHPLSGARELGDFSLDPGRLCVLLSRHQLAVVAVARDGLREALDRHEHDSASRPSGSENVTWRGWKANLALVDALERDDRVVRLSS